MKYAILCNGPSRTAYDISTSYDQILGTNCPWGKVNATVICDNMVLKLWVRQPGFISVPCYLSTEAWKFAVKNKHEDFFKPFLLETFKPGHPTSSGHEAAKIAISKGASQLDIYGADAAFSDVTISYTRSLIKYRDPSVKVAMRWRKKWREFHQANPTIPINFIKGDGSILKASNIPAC